MSTTLRRIGIPTVLAAAVTTGAVSAHAQEPALTLGGAAAAALEADPALAASVARVRGAEADLDRAGAERWPTIRVEATATRFQEPMVVAPLHSFDPSSPPRFDDRLLQGAARLRYTVFDGGRIGAGVDAARSGVGATEAAVSARRMETLERVTAAYLTVLGARARRDAAELRVTALEAEASRARDAVEAGTAAEVELLRASASLQESLAEAATARTRTEQAERALARVMGSDPAAVVGRPLDDVDAPSSATTGRSPPDTHPALESARARSRAARERVDAERAARLPRIDLDAAVRDYGTWSGDHVAEWQAGIALSWPIFTGGARGAAIRRAEADLEVARRDVEAARRSLESRLDAARSDRAEADARIGALRASVAQWEEVARIEALSLETGAGVQSDLLTAEASLFRARAGLAEARYDRVLAEVRLARALGYLDEGWLERTLEADR